MFVWKHGFLPSVDTNFCDVSQTEETQRFVNFGAPSTTQHYRTSLNVFPLTSRISSSTYNMSLSAGKPKLKPQPSYISKETENKVDVWVGELLSKLCHKPFPGRKVPLLTWLVLPIPWQRWAYSQGENSGKSIRVQGAPQHCNKQRLHACAVLSVAPSNSEQCNGKGAEATIAENTPLTSNDSRVRAAGT